MRDDWSTLRKLMFQRLAAGGSLKEYEAEGNPAVFQTNVQKPLSGFTIPFLPVQTGDGDPSPQNLRPISGWSGVTTWRTGINVIDDTKRYFNNHILYVGATDDNYSVFLPAGKYTVTVVYKSGKRSSMYIRKQGGSVELLWGSNSEITSAQVTLEGGFYNIYAYVSTLASEDVEGVMVSYGETASPYAEYTGQSYPVTFPAVGKNLFDKSNSDIIKTGLNITSAGKVSGSSTSTTVFFPCKANQAYSITKISTQRAAIAYTKTADIPVANDDVFGYTNMANLTTSTITTGEDATFLCVYLNNTSYGDVNTQDVIDSLMIAEGSTALPYEPFENTVYGGTLDAVNGVLTVTHMNFITTWGAGTNKTVIGEYERRKYTLPKTNVSSSAVQGSRYCNVAKWWWDYSTDGVAHFYCGGDTAYVILPVGTSDSQEIQIVGELATPYEIPLSDITVPVTLIGDNTIWTDTNGSNTIKYKKKG